MRVLVVGGTGLISTAISRQLLERGDEVTLFNRGRTSSRLPAGARTIEGDRYDPERFVAKVREAGPFDAIVDMITYGPKEAESLLEAAKGTGAHVVFCSTVDVYRKPATVFPYTEAEPRESLSDYGRNKVKCEDIVATYEGPWTVIRPAATYGEGGTLIHPLGWGHGFLDRIRRGMPIAVMGDGTALWVMCHVDDCARAFVGALGNERAFGKSYHATGEEWFDWNRYVEIVAEAVGGPKPTLVHIPTDAIARMWPDTSSITVLNFQYPNIYDNTAAKEDLGFRYTIPFREGAERTYRWAFENGKVETAEESPEYDELLRRWDAAMKAL